MTTPTLCLMLSLVAGSRWLSRIGLGGALGEVKVSKVQVSAHGKTPNGTCRSLISFTSDIGEQDESATTLQLALDYGAARSRGREIRACDVSLAVGLA
jgi:hypothetical protein